MKHARFNPRPSGFSYQTPRDRDRVMKPKNTVALSSKFQITIRKAIRTSRHWQFGQVFAFIPKGDGMLLVPIPSLVQLAGLARGAKPDNYRDRTNRV